MSELLSSGLLRKLREDADKLSRPAERHATIDRLVEACDAIASGDAREVIRKGNPDAEAGFRRRPTLIRPPRVEEYVVARRMQDVAARRRSSWTGPMATTIRKDRALLDYVRAREEEQEAVRPGKVAPSADNLLDAVEDMNLRTQLRFVLAKARIAEQDLLRLKQGMRKLRPTLDFDKLLTGQTEGQLPEKIASESTSPGALTSADAATLARATAAIMKLTSSAHLSRCGLEFNRDFGNVVERKTRFELLGADELAALRELSKSR